MKRKLAKFLGIFVCSISVFSSGSVNGGKPWDLRDNGGKPWNLRDDSILLDGVSISGGHWLFISYKLFNGKRTPSECERRYNEDLKPALEKEWSREDINLLYRKVIWGLRWEDFEKFFSMPAAVIKKKFDENIDKFKEIMQTMDEDCSWVPKQLWVNDADISD